MLLGTSSKDMTISGGILLLYVAVVVLLPGDVRRSETSDVSDVWIS
jgi:small neutral amino acid transporter SnatA (MarC family)